MKPSINNLQLILLVTKGVIKFLLRSMVNMEFFIFHQFVSRGGAELCVLGGG